jgi:hypothetical protein
MSPNARTMKWLRDHHIEAQIVERRLPRGFTTIDLFDNIDIIALPNRILGIQTTTGDHHSHRERKAETNVRLARWIVCGGGFEVWSWRKSTRTKRWVRRVSVGHLVMEEHETFVKIEFTEKEETNEGETG